MRIGTICKYFMFLIINSQFYHLLTYSIIYNLFYHQSIKSKCTCFCYSNFFLILLSYTIIRTNLMQINIKKGNTKITKTKNSSKHEVKSKKIYYTNITIHHHLTFKSKIVQTRSPIKYLTLILIFFIYFQNFFCP